MNNLKSISLKWWVPLLVSSVMVVLAAVIILQSMFEYQTTLTQTSLRTLTQDMLTLQREIEHAQQMDDDSSARQALTLRGVNPNYRILLATDENGVIKYSTRFSMVGKSSQMEVPGFDLDVFLSVKENNKYYVHINHAEDLIAAYFPLQAKIKQNEIRTFDKGVIFVTYDLSAEKRLLWENILIKNIPAAIGLLLAFLAAVVFMNLYVNRPFKYLLKKTNELAADNLKSPCVIDGSGEFASLAYAFNNMANKLFERRLQRDAAEQSLIESERKTRDVLDNTSAVIYIKDLEGKYTFVNRMFIDTVLVNNEKILGRTDFDVFSKDLATQYVKNDKHAIKVGKPVTLEETAMQNGVIHTYVSIKFPLVDSKNNVYAVCGISTDISDRKRNEEKIEHQAYYDNLTNLPNRFLVLDRLNKAISEVGRTNKLGAVLFLDMDDFKKVNDSLGHDAGDVLLQNAAQRFTRTVRSSDTVGRLGGDEFIILLLGLNGAADATQVAENLLNLFKKPFTIDDRELMLTASIGIAVFPGDGDSSSDLLRNADSAMYNAKKLGRNTYSFFTESMNKKISRRINLEEKIFGALDRDEFSVVYQPQVDVKSGEIIGAEALLRWTSPDLGVVSPAEFIPIAELTGLIVTLGDFVLRRALEVTALWLAESSPPFRMAVNLSPIQFRDVALVNRVKANLEQMAVSAENLELEITEGVLLEGHQLVKDALIEFTNMGIRIAMDDFGTGYSSLSYLRQYKFDVIKIDQSFVQDLTSDPADRKLIGAIIAMAHGMGLTVVAEGVETAQQLAVLAELQCDIAQGYFLHRPLAQNVFLALAKN